MPSYTETRELLAPIEDVWLFVAEPHHFADWWPGISGVHPDRRGLAPGARWTLTASMRPSLFRRPAAESTLLVREVDAPVRASWHMTAERLDVELELSDAGNHRTHAELTVSGRFLVGPRRMLPRNALSRLHALCQTAAEL